MQGMDNKKAIEAIEKYTLHKYLEKLIDAKMHKLTLFTHFAQTGAPNLSDPRHLIIIEDLAKLSALNSGAVLN